MSKQLLYVTLILISFISMGGTIEGKVVDHHNEPLPGATLRIVATSLGTSSQFDGSYRIQNVPAGTYTLSITSLGFKEVSKQFQIKGNQTLHFDFSMEEDTEELQEVVVVGESVKKEIETKGFAVNVVETKEVSLRNIQTNELLNMTVGVKIRQNGGLGSEVDYSLNGLSGNSVKIFIDGIPISTYGNSFNLNSIPPSMIKQIEVYKGVVPGYLADDALGGAINIVLHKGTKTNLNASVSYGSFNTFQTSVNGLYRFEKSGLTVKASGFHNYSDNDYKVWGGRVQHIEINASQTPITARRFNDAYRSTGGMAHIGFTDVKWADQFFIGLTASDDYKEVQHGAFMTLHPYNGRFLESDALLSNLTYMKKDLFIKGLDVNLNAVRGKRNRIVNDTVAQAYTWKGVKMQRQDFDNPGGVVDHKYPWGSQQEGGPTLAEINRIVQSVRTGASFTINENHKFLVNYVYSSIDREDSDELRPLFENTFVGTRDLRKKITSVTYELNALDNKLKSSVFLKHYKQKTINTDPDINEETKELYDEVTKANVKDEGYGLTVSYAVFPNIVLLTSAEKAIRLPNENEVFGNDGDNVRANPGIRPEISNNYNLGFRLGTFRIKKHFISVSTNVFARNIKDRIGLPIESSENIDNEIILFENQGNGSSKGIEGQLDYSYNNNFGLSYNISKLELKVINGGVEVDVPNTPFFTMNGGLRYSFKNLIQKSSQMNLFYNVYFTDEFSYLVPQGANTVGADFFDIPRQISHDFGMSYVFPNNQFVVSLDLKNIFNQAVYDNMSVQKPGRAFYLKINYRINKL